MKSINIRAAEILESAAFVVFEPSNWTQGALARDKYGWLATPGSDDAACFCAEGALDQIEWSLSEEGFAARRELSNQTEGLVEFNDTPGRTSQEVAEAMWHAADSLRAKG